MSINEMPEECPYCGHDFVENPEDWMGEFGHNCCADCVATAILEGGGDSAEDSNN